MLLIEEFAHSKFFITFKNLLCEAQIFLPICATLSQKSAKRLGIFAVSGATLFSGSKTHLDSFFSDSESFLLEDRNLPQISFSSNVLNSKFSSNVSNSTVYFSSSKQFKKTLSAFCD
jgi:hypothetical protein